MAYLDSETGQTLKVYDWTRKRDPLRCAWGSLTRPKSLTDLGRQAGFSPDGTLFAFGEMRDTLHNPQLRSSGCTTWSMANRPAF